MRPAVVLLGFLLGSAVAVTFSLIGVAIVVLLLQSDYPRLEGELEPLLVNLGVFLLLTAVAGLSFYGEIKRRAWRWLSTIALALTLLALGGFYWPS